jgi:hypothetical protein
LVLCIMATCSSSSAFEAASPPGGNMRWNFNDDNVVVRLRNAKQVMNHTKIKN